MSCPSSHYQYADIIVEVLWMPLGHIEILLIPTTETDPAQFKFLLLEIDFSFRLLFLASAVRSSSSHRILQSPWFRSHPDDNASILVEVSINLRWRKNIFFEMELVLHLLFSPHQARPQSRWGPHQTTVQAAQLMRNSVFNLSVKLVLSV